MIRTASMLRGAAALGMALSLAGCGRERPWNVLVVTFDTTRADFIGCYGKETARTPTLDGLAAEGYLFEHAFAAVPVTLPSHSTLFTGTYPPVHGVRDNGMFNLPPERTTLAEMLRDQGYATAAAIGAFPLKRSFGLDQGFDVYDDELGRPPITSFAANPQRQNLFFDERPASQVNDAILPWLRENAEQPFFAWIHYWDPHHPHVPPAPFNQLYLGDPYQGEIAYADHSLGIVLEELKRQGVYDRTMVVVTSDHGEGRGAHNEETHSQLAYNTTLHVPLIMRVPGPAAGRRITQRVGTVDVVPTVASLLDLPLPDEVEGRSLAGLLTPEGREPDSRGRYYAETLSPRLSHGWGELRVLFEGPYKYIHGPRPELFNVRSDPGEIDNLIAQEPDQAEAFRNDLSALLKRSQQRASAVDAVREADAETRQRLAALGYISAGGADPSSITEALRDDGVAPQDRAGDISHMSRVKSLLDGERFLEAREGARQLLRRDPGNTFYRGLLARSLLGLEQVDEAARLLEEVPPVEALSDGSFLDVARVLFTETGQQRRALALIERVLADNASAMGYYLLGEMHAALEEPEAYEQALDQALELDPGHAPSRLSRAILLAQRGDHDEAAKTFLGLLEDQPLNPRFHYNYAVLLLETGRSADAEQHLERASRLRPSYWKAHLTRLAVLLDRQQHDAAEALHAQIRRTCSDPDVLSQADALMEQA